MRFKLFGVGISLSLPFTAMLAAMILLDKSGLLIAAFLAASVHEMCHIFAMLICGTKPYSVRFCVGAVEIARPHRPLSRRGEILISLSGPMSNIILGMILLGFYGVTQQTIVANYGIVQLSMGAFNLLPIMGLDGGTIVEILTGSRFAVIITSAVTIVGVILWQCLWHSTPWTESGLVLSMLYICAMQLMCIKKNEAAPKK